MILRKILIPTLLMISSIISSAQKAYETIEYTGMVNGMMVKLSLADGYLGASKITLNPKNKKPSIFIPENGVEDANGQLKFPHYTTSLKPSKPYFLLSRLQDSFNVIPPEISGKYYDGKNQYPIILKKKK